MRWMSGGRFLQAFQNFELALLFMSRQRQALPGTVLGYGFGGKIIQESSGNIVFDLAIPKVREAG